MPRPTRAATRPPIIEDSGSSSREPSPESSTPKRRPRQGRPAKKDTKKPVPVYDVEDSSRSPSPAAKRRPTQAADRTEPRQNPEETATTKKSVPKKKDTGLPNKDVESSSADGPSTSTKPEDNSERMPSPAKSPARSSRTTQNAEEAVNLPEGEQVVFKKRRTAESYIQEIVRVWESNPTPEKPRTMDRLMPTPPRERARARKNLKERATTKSTSSKKVPQKRSALVSDDSDGEEYGQSSSRGPTSSRRSDGSPSSSRPKAVPKRKYTRKAPVNVEDKAGTSSSTKPSTSKKVQPKKPARPDNDRDISSGEELFGRLSDTSFPETDGQWPDSPDREPLLPMPDFNNLTQQDFDNFAQVPQFKPVTPFQKKQHKLALKNQKESVKRYEHYKAIKEAQEARKAGPSEPKKPAPARNVPVTPVSSRFTARASSQGGPSGAPQAKKPAPSRDAPATPISSRFTARASSQGGPSGAPQAKKPAPARDVLATPSFSRFAASSSSQGGPSTSSENRPSASIDDFQWLKPIFTRVTPPQAPRPARDPFSIGAFMPPGAMGAVLKQQPIDKNFRRIPVEDKKVTPKEAPAFHYEPVKTAPARRFVFKTPPPNFDEALDNNPLLRNFPGIRNTPIMVSSRRDARPNTKYRPSRAIFKRDGCDEDASDDDVDESKIILNIGTYLSDREKARYLHLLQTFDESITPQEAARKQRILRGQIWGFKN